MAQFKQGDAVKVYETAGVAGMVARYDVDPGQPATIVREMPHWREDGKPEPEYEVDVASAGDVIVSESRILPAE